MKKQPPKREGFGLNQKLVVEAVSVSTIRPHPKNSRIHDEENLQSIMRSLAAFGQRTPIVVGSANQVIKGCGTLEAVKRLGWTTIQIVRADFLPESQQVAYALADNKTSDLSEFDFESVAGVLRYLDGEKVDLASTGFRSFEVEPLLLGDFSAGSADMPEPGETTSGTKIHFDNEQWLLVQEILTFCKEREIVEKEAREVDIIMYLINLARNKLGYSARFKNKKQPPPTPHNRNLLGGVPLSEREL